MIILHIIFIIIVMTVGFVMFFYSSFLNKQINGKSLTRFQQEPEITIIIPMFNEEKFIARKIENTKLLDYPKDKLQILVVDNESTDNSRKIAQSMGVAVLSSPKGKVNALNKGLQCAKFDFILATDADTTLTSNSVRSAVKLIHKDVAAVSATTKVNPKKSFYSAGKIEYHKKDWSLRYREGILDTCCSLDGKFMLFRKSDYPQFPAGTLVDDFDLTIDLRIRGLRSVVDNNAIVYEESPSNLQEELKQIRRRMVCTIPRSLKLINLMFSKKLGKFSSYILPWRRFIVLFFPVFAVYGIFYIFYFLPIIWAVVLLLLGFFIGIWKFSYMLIQLYGLSLAWWDVLSGRAKPLMSWEKIEQ